MGELRKIMLIYILVLLIFDIAFIFQTNNNVEGQGEEEFHENPFRTYYSEPTEITDMIIDSNADTMYIGCEYGLIIKDMNSENFQVISYFDGVDNNKIETIELDEENSRLFILVKENNDVFVLNLTTNEIIEKLHIYSPSTMVNAADYKHMIYDDEFLYLGGDAGLCVLNLSSHNFDFYDLFFFDVNYDRYEIIGDTLYADISDHFSINAFDYNERTEELYMATSIGLTTFNTSSKTFENHRNESFLSGYIDDVIYVEEIKSIFLAKTRMIRYDITNNVTAEYPIIRSFFSNNTHSVRSLAYDSVHKFIYASVDNGGLAIFDSLDPVIIENFSYEYNEHIEPMQSSLPHLQYHDGDGVLYMGNGWFSREWTQWNITYTFTEETSQVIQGENLIKTWTTNKHLKTKYVREKESDIAYEAGIDQILYSYSPNSHKFTPLNITNHVKFGGNIYDIEVHLNSGKTFVSHALRKQRLTVIDTNGHVIQPIAGYGGGGHSNPRIYDIEFINDTAYMGWDDGLKVMNMTTGEITNITDEKLTKCYSIDIGKKSGKLYIKTDDSVVIFDPKTNASQAYPFPYGESRNDEDIAVDPDEQYVNVMHFYQLWRLILSNGTLIKVDEVNDQFFHPFFKEIEYHKGLNSYIFLEYDGFFCLDESLFDSFPETNTLSDFSIDQTTGKIYAVTGQIDFEMHSHYSHSTELVDGLIIYDIENKTYVNYSIANGLPSNMLTGITVDPLRQTIHITGYQFYTVVNESDLSSIILRKQIPVIDFQPTPSSSIAENQVMGFKGKEDNNILYIGISLGTLVGIMTFTFEPTKFKLLTMFATPLYSRIKKDEVLDNETRGRIRGHIESDPGIHYNELKKKLKLKNGSLSYHLQVLLREGFIKSKNNGIYKHFFPGDMKLPKKIIRMTEVQKIILKTILENPGISQVKIAESIGGSSSTVNYNINILAKKGIIDLKKAGKKTECNIIEES